LFGLDSNSEKKKRKKKLALEYQKELAINLTPQRYIHIAMCIMYTEIGYKTNGPPTPLTEAHLDEE